VYACSELTAEADVPRRMVARPRAVPIPRPFMALGPTRLNLEEGREGGRVSERDPNDTVELEQGRTNMGAFASMSGTM
jgi:hypothetical protein